MGMVLEVMSGSVLNPGATLTAVTNNAGDSTVVRSFTPGTNAQLLSAWALGATAGSHRVRSPRLHDNVNNLLFNYKAAVGQPLYDEGVQQDIFSQDTLIVEQSGGGAETDIESILLWYQDVPGMAARLYQLADIFNRIVHYVTLTFPLTTGATLGAYVGTTAFSAATGSLRANQDYAILGYETSAAVGTVGIRGPDTGNARVGGPGTTQQLETRSWFNRIARENQLPCIPVINSANVGGTLLDVTQNAANVNPTVNVLLALLAT